MSIGVAAIPFAFALMRAVQTGSDLRYLWVALAASCGAVASILVARLRDTRPSATIMLSVGVFVIATLLAVLTALLLGTTLGPAVIVVGAAFGFCFAASTAVNLLARH